VSYLGQDDPRLEDIRRRAQDAVVIDGAFSLDDVPGRRFD
jgi:hypothetical protein